MDTDFDQEQARIAERVMIDIISSVPGFTPPSQARSRETTYAIIVAAVDLLREQSYASIRMQDIAERAGCAVTAIYARFLDKNTLLHAIQLLLLEEVRPVLDRRIRTEHFTETGVFGLACTFMEVNGEYFRVNSNYVIAAITMTRQNVYQNTALIMADYTLRISKVVAEILDVDITSIRGSVSFAIHTILSIYRDGVLAENALPIPSEEALARLFTSIIEHRLEA